MALELNLSWLGSVDECQHFQQRAFAAAVGTDNTGNGAGFYRQGFNI